MIEYAYMEIFTSDREMKDLHFQLRCLRKELLELLTSKNAADVELRSVSAAEHYAEVARQLWIAKGKFQLNKELKQNGT